MTANIHTHTKCAGCGAITERGEGGQAYLGYNWDAPLVYLCDACFDRVLVADRIDGDKGASLPHGYFYLHVE